MKIVGLTGGIASGKSTVARVLRELGATVVDADVLAREVVAPGGPAWREIAERWPQVIGPDGAVDRKRLGDIVFADASARRALEAMTHPHIFAESARLFQEAEARGEQLAYFEAALLIEQGLDRGFDETVVVSVPREVQLERLRARDGLDETAAQARLAAQFPLEEKVRRATRVIDNSGSPEQTRRAVEQLHRELLAAARAAPRSSP